jgi:serine/threonine-protein kinase
MAEHGRYKIIRRVADGGMAEIFLATQTGREGFQKPVILKRIHSTIYGDPQFRNMFIDEAHISMSLSHSNIAQVLDLGVSAGRYFLVLELVDGWDLGRILYRAAAAGVRLPRELALHIGAEICRALAYAHSKAIDGQGPLGIVHRDVSPHNVLLSEQGEVKLTDFGIAKAMNKREHTGTGVVKGKVAFMSPEQALGKPIDARSDLFSLGTMLYLMVTRTRPFEGPSDLETLLRVQQGDFAAPETVAPDLPPEVAALISRAMQRDPDERYQSADEMLADVERVLRTVFLPVGQSELKRWLADLTARDGVLPISQAAARSTVTRTSSGTGDLEEEDVVLLDSQGAEEIDGEEATSLALVKGGGVVRPRISRPRAGPMLPLPDDAESMADRDERAQIALIPEGDEPPGRRRVRRGGGFSILIIGAILVGGAWLGGKYARLWFGGGGESAGNAGAGPQGNDRPGAQPAVGKEGSSDKARAAANDAGRPSGLETGEASAANRHLGEPSTAREPAARRVHGTEHSAERPKDHLRHEGPDLQNLMAPDPSLLPPTPPPEKSADTPEPARPAPDNP